MKVKVEYGQDIFKYASEERDVSGLTTAHGAMDRLFLVDPSFQQVMVCTILSTG